jgi:hypothetical protein
MKKSMKKLALAKETVRDLDELANVRGGVAIGTEHSCTARHCPRDTFPSLA